MDDELDRMRRGVSGRLVIGTFQSASSRLLPWIVGNMRKDLPDVDIRLSELDDVQLLVRALLDDELDFAFTIDLEADPALEIELLGVDPFVVIAPRAEAVGASACAADLNDRPLIGQPNNDSCQLMIDRRLEGVGIRPDYVFRSQDNGAVQGMVRSGLGWAIMPYLAIDPHDPGIAVLAARSTGRAASDPARPAGRSHACPPPPTTSPAWPGRPASTCCRPPPPPRRVTIPFATAEPGRHVCRTTGSGQPPRLPARKCERQTSS